MTADTYPTAHCRDAECGAEIIWTVSKARNKPQPIDAQPSDDGTILITNDGVLLRSEVVDPVAPPLGGWPSRLRTPHHQTCVAADRWRNSRKGTK